MILNNLLSLWRLKPGSSMSVHLSLSLKVSTVLQAHTYVCMMIISNIIMFKELYVVVSGCCFNGDADHDDDDQDDDDDTT